MNSQGKLNILVVDDSETVQDVIGKTLRLARIPIDALHRASNGQEALKILREEWIDLVLADINMPVMGGLEMIDKMAEDELLRNIPVIVVSTEGSATRINDLREKGIAGYVRKPFMPEQFQEVLNEVLGVINDG